MTAQQAIAWVLVAIGAIVSLLNWATVVSSLRTGRFSSAVPLVGAIFLGTGAVLLPALRPYAGFAILLDYGTLALLLGTPTIVREAWATCRINLLEEYVGQQGITTVGLRLFRRGIFTLRWDIKRAPGEPGIMGMGLVGTWEREADSLVLRIGENRAILMPFGEGASKAWCQSAGFADCEQTRDLSLRGVEFVRSA